MRRIWLWSLLLVAVLLGAALPVQAAGTGSVYREAPMVSVSDEDADLPDNDTCFAMYFQELSSPSAQLLDYGSRYLTGQELALYTAMKGKIQAVADGSVTDTRFVFTPQNLGLESSYTVGTDSDSDLVLTEDVFYRNGQVSNPTLLVNAVASLTSGLDIQLVHAHLLADCPATFYWYDKTLGYLYSTRFGFLFYYDSDSGLVEEVELSDFGIYFSVATDYRASASDSYTVSSAAVTSAKAAVANAQSYVTQYAGKTDYEKLLGYKEAICGLVSYNHGAVADGVTPSSVGINPWQLIYVFDKNSSTNVVCEGYSKAFQYLCDLSDFSRPVECYTVTGDFGLLTDYGGHMFNLVRIGWKSFLVDVTNCDYPSIGYPSELFLKGGLPDSSDRDRYTWTVAGSTLFYRYHGADDEGSDDQRALYGDVLTLYPSNYVKPTSGQPDNDWYYDRGDRFVLTTAEEVAGLIELVNSAGFDFAGKTVSLANDIDLTALAGWTAIGTADHPFQGTLDGGGYRLTLPGGGVFLAQVGSAGTVTKLGLSGGVLCADNAGLVEDCFNLTGAVVTANTGTVRHCLSLGAQVVGASTGTVEGCFYQDTSETDALDGTAFQTASQLASGAAAWALQAGRADPVWGQSLGADSRPVLTSSAALQVYQARFLTGDAVHALAYTNSGGTVSLPAAPVKEGYVFYRWALTQDPEADAFTADTPVTADRTVYAVMRELYGQESGTHSLVTTYGTAASLDLSSCVGYADQTPAAGRFHYTLQTAEKDGAALSDVSAVASVSADALVLSDTAPAGTYLFTVLAQELSPQVSLFSLTASGTDSVTFPVTVTVEKAPSAVTAPPQAKTLAYTGGPLALVTPGEALGGQMAYSLDGVSYSFDPPTAVELGSYSVYYQVVGDSNHLDTEPAGPVAVTIREPWVTAGTPEWDGVHTWVALEPAPGDLLSGASIFAVRYEGAAMAGLAMGTRRDGGVTFSRDLTAQTGWTLYFLDADLAPLCAPVPLP